MSNRKLLISSLNLLRRRSRPISTLPTNRTPKSDPPIILDHSSRQSAHSRVPKKPIHGSKLDCAVFGRDFSSTSSGLGNCWSCGAIAASKPFLFCDICRSVQPFDQSVDYFQIFGLERAFAIDDTGMESKYKDWQKKLHPDLVHTKSEKEKEYAAEQSARVIDAYRTLRSPLLRAIYLMQLEGARVDEEQTVSDPELLAEIMEIREAVEEAANPPALQQIQFQVKGSLDHWSKSFENAFKKRKFEEAITSIQRMTYYSRINEEIMRKL
ncbi:hypothetical protein Syun_017849 [Stephania yunnanensis]|uniref:J domain-containing protein n=1 Tax=Stephania yunnanensis TaxID=152371 RepID=A0AAP0P2T6_9MAGN